MSKAHKCSNVITTSALKSITPVCSTTVEEVPEQLSNTNHDSVSSPSGPVLASTKDSLIKFVAKMYADHKLPRNFVQGALDDTLELCQNFNSSIKSKVQTILREANVDDGIIESVADVVDSTADSFSLLGTEHCRFKELKKTGCYIEATDHTIGARVDNVIKYGVGSRVIIPVNAKFVPMRLVLKKFFSLPGVYYTAKSHMSQLLQEHDVFVQGSLWRNKIKAHFQGKTVFPLLIYFDDFEVNDPLGSHATIRKIGAVYYSIMSFLPEFNSRLENIFTAMLFLFC